MANPLVSVLFLNCNRLKFLKNSVGSFFECNQYPNVEVIICDNGSTEPGTHEWLDGLDHVTIKHIVRMEDSSRIAVAKNRCRQLASGEYFLDVHEDFQFISRGNWMVDLIDIANTVPQPLTVFYYATVASKLSSYATEPARTSSGSEYFRVLSAGYHDVHFMSRRLWEKLGSFPERSAQRLNLFGRTITIEPSDARDVPLRERLKQWMLMPLLPWAKPSLEGYETAYSLRAEKFGFGRGSRVMLKYPIAAPLAFPDLARYRQGRLTGYYPDCNAGSFYYEILPYEEIKRKYSTHPQPVGLEELCRVVGIEGYQGDISQKLHYT